MSRKARTLAIETATEACSVALFDGNTLIAHDHREIGRGHAERLVPMIGALPDKGRADRILVSLGPGSFTGVRIGIATARALGFAWRAQVLGYPTLALVAAIAQAECNEPVTVCMNGGHGEWFIEDFGPDAMSQTPMASLTKAQAEARDVHDHIAGNRALELAQLHEAARSPALTILPDARFATGLSDDHFTDQVSPTYGRPPDAKPQVAA